MSSGIRKFIYTTVGVLFVAIGFIGILLPGIPTTGPLLLASFLLAKGNPRIEKLLIRNRVFKNYLHYLDGSTVMPMKARYWSIAWMWLGIGFSTFVFLRSMESPIPYVAACLIAGLIGTRVILRFRRSVPQAGDGIGHNDTPEEQLLQEIDMMAAQLRVDTDAKQPRPVPSTDSMFETGSVVAATKIT